MDPLERLLGHDHWATTQLLELSQGLTDAQLDQPFDIGHGSLRETLNHLIFVVDFWTGWMAGQPVTWEREVQRSVSDLIERHQRFYATFATFARRVHDEQRLEDTFVDHFGSQMTFGGAVLHVILHNAEHRSEAVHILGRLGVHDPPEVDHGLWDFERRGV
ncbi:MAG: DinB family protein [Chloroflexota bacterium]|nr:DinB family protein [Chloroflexota bacterium]